MVTTKHCCYGVCRSNSLWLRRVIPINVFKFKSCRFQMGHFFNMATLQENVTLLHSTALALKGHCIEFTRLEYYADVFPPNVQLLLARR